MPDSESHPFITGYEHVLTCQISHRNFCFIQATPQSQGGHYCLSTSYQWENPDLKGDITKDQFRGVRDTVYSQDLDSNLCASRLHAVSTCHIEKYFSLQWGNLGVQIILNKRGQCQANRWKPAWQSFTQKYAPKEIKPVSLKGYQPWILLGRTDAEAETPVFWSSGMNSYLIGKVPDDGKDWGQKEKMASEDEMAGWHHRCNGHELGQTLGDGEGHRGLACCCPWGHKEWDTTGWLNNNNMPRNELWLWETPSRRAAFSFSPGLGKCSPSSLYFKRSFRAGTALHMTPGISYSMVPSLLSRPTGIPLHASVFSAFNCQADLESSIRLSSSLS